MPSVEPAFRTDVVDPSRVAALAEWLSAQPRQIYFVGIGGTGLSALAVLAHELGHTVTGSDRAVSPGSAALEARGIEVHVPHRDAVPGTPGAVVVSTAIPADNPELVDAADRDVPVYRRSEFLGALSRLAPTVAITGTHGKTTSTGMAATVWTALRPATAYLVGSPVAHLAAAASWPAGAAAFVVEADESDRTHLALAAAGALVTNIEAEHLDRYGSLGQVVDAFVEFVTGVDGPVVMCGDDPGASLVAAHAHGAQVIRYGFDPRGDVVVESVETDGLSAAAVLHGLGADPIAMTLSVPGRHNVLNAAGVVTLAAAMGLDPAAAAAAITAFTGTSRRFERKGIAREVTFVDDYAHHPTEVAATLATARAHPGRVVAVFQPHLFSRTLANAEEFGRVLGAADVAVITDVYAAREAPIPGVSGQLVADALGDGCEAVYVADRKDVAATLAKLVRPGDLCVTMGAGDITHLYDEVRPLLDGSTDRGAQ